MIWEDMLIERSLTDDQIQCAIAEVFEVPPSEVERIGDDLGSATDGDLPRVVYRRWPATGDFLSRVEASVDDDQVRPVLLGQGHLGLVSRLSLAWKSPVLIGDDSVDPSAWLLMSGPDRIQLVHIDLGEEEDDVYRLLRVSEGVIR